MRRRRIAIAACAAGLVLVETARADLDEYVRQPDPSFAWTAGPARESPAGRVVPIRLTSQTWRGIAWEHQVRIYEPAQVRYPDAALLFISGGSRDHRPGPEDDRTGFLLASVCGARVVVLPQVPNQPLLDGKSEDDLIAETFVRYLDSKEETWPLLFPMVKSAVRAMDAAQEWAKANERPIGRFVVTGASKRGWTTWLTGAVDKRVVAIAPMVIPTLNMRAQNRHQLEVWGRYSEQIEDYTRRGLTEKIDTPEGTKLWHMIDPYSYRDRLTMPKLQINGTNDRYWTLDSVNLYWDDLKGPKWVVYLPNAGHGLEQHRDYAVNGVGALFRHVVSGRPMPEVSWEFDEGDGGALVLRMSAKPEPKAALAWAAATPTHDFREAIWSPARVTKNKRSVVATVARPDRGHAALFGDLTFEIDGLEYHLSTQIREVGPKATR